jgi:hypothetical protein
MSVDPWAGLHVTGLCVGVGDYRHEDKLDNAVRDAEEVNKRLNSVPNCCSALLENPALPRELLRKIIECLQKPGLREKPPELCQALSVLLCGTRDPAQLEGVSGA